MASYQLASTVPDHESAESFTRIVTNVVFSAGQVLTVVFGMGTGVAPDRIATGQNWDKVDSNHRPHAYQACALTG